MTDSSRLATLQADRDPGPIVINQPPSCMPTGPILNLLPEARPEDSHHGKLYATSLFFLWYRLAGSRILIKPAGWIAYFCLKNTSKSGWLKYIYGVGGLDGQTCPMETVVWLAGKVGQSRLCCADILAGCSWLSLLWRPDQCMCQKPR
jgi:hypothetical protein